MNLTVDVCFLSPLTIDNLFSSLLTAIKPDKLHVQSELRNGSEQVQVTRVSGYS